MLRREFELLGNSDITGGIPITGDFVCCATNVD
jgi:hypothetical protein